MIKHEKQGWHDDLSTGFCQPILYMKQVDGEIAVMDKRPFSGS